MNLLNLDEFTNSFSAASEDQIATVDKIPLAKIQEDPNQPRQEFDELALQALADDIAVRGVQSPIHVKPANENGLYQIIQGARRFRASRLVGCDWIPSIIEADEILFDEYSQVSENTKRADLTAMDMARFIKRRKDVHGEKNKQIAERLGEGLDYITFHLALLDAPGPILEAFSVGRIKGAQAVWQICRLWEKSQLAAQALLKIEGDITNRMIRKAMDSIDQPPALLSPVNGEQAVGNEVISVVSEQPDPGQTLSEKDDKKPVIREPRSNLESGGGIIATPPNRDHETPGPITVETHVHNAGNESGLSGADSRHDIKRLKAPAVYGIIDGMPVEICITLEPSDSGFVWVKPNGAKKPEEVLADKVTLSRIIESA